MRASASTAKTDPPKLRVSPASIRAIGRARALSFGLRGLTGVYAILTLMVELLGRKRPGVYPASR